MLPKKSEKSLIIILCIAFYLILASFGCHLAKAQYTAGIHDSGIDIFNDAMEDMKSNPLDIMPITAKTFQNIGIMTVLYVVILFSLYVEQQRNKTDNPLKAKWGANNDEYKKHYVTPYTKADYQAGKVDPNILLAQDFKLSMDTRKTQRNLNTLCVGGSGAGKSRFVIKPNLLQMNASFVVTDPSGEILRDCGMALADAGFDLKLFSISDMERSNVYNPFDYVYDEKGNVDENQVSIMVSTFIKNATDMQKKGGGDQFWVKSAQALIMALSMYLLEFRSRSERNFTNVLALVQAGRVNENDSSSTKTALDKVFDNAFAINPDARCFSSYNTFKLAGAKTASSILVSAAVDLDMFGREQVKNLTQSDLIDIGTKDERLSDKNLNLHTIGDRKTALFINIPQADGTYKFLVSMLYSQLFGNLYRRAEKKCALCSHIWDENNLALASMLPNKRAAELLLDKYKTAKVVNMERKVKGKENRSITDFCIYSEDADLSKKYPGKAKNIIKRWDSDARIFFVYEKTADGEKLIDVGMKDGILRTFFTQKGAEVFLKQANKGHIVSGNEMLSIHVRCMLDEFANIGDIPNFSQYVATMRKYGISVTIVLQSTVQLESMYDKDAKVIIGNCDIFVFLGATELETCKYLSERMGKTEAVVRSNGRSRSGKGENTSLNFQKKDVDLMPVSELSKLKNNMSIIMIRGESPFMMEKINYEKLPNYSFTGDADKNRRILKDFLDDYFKCPDKNGQEKKRKKQIETLGKKIDQAHSNTAPDKYADNKQKPLLSKPVEVRNTKELLEATGSKNPEEIREKIKSDHDTAKTSCKKAMEKNRQEKRKKSEQEEEWMFTARSVSGSKDKKNELPEISVSSGMGLPF